MASVLISHTGNQLAADAGANLCELMHRMGLYLLSAPARVHPGTWSGPSRTSCRSFPGGWSAWPGRPEPETGTGTGHGGAAARLHGIIGRLLAARRGERNRLLFWASPRVGEPVAEGTWMRVLPGRR